MRSSQSLSRRRFLKRSGAVLGSAAALPYFVPRDVLASEAQAGANDRIGVGYLGCGRRAQQLMKLPREGVIVAACDVAPGRAQHVAKRTKFKGFKTYADYHKLLEDKNVDAVVIASPDHWRAIQCIHACQAGKDIYAEKPLTLTIHEGRQIAKAVKHYERVMQVGSQQRSMAANQRACKLIRDGAIGRVHTVIGCAYPSPWRMKLPEQTMPEGLDWEKWCGPAPLIPFNKDIFTPRANPGWISVWPFSGGEMTGWGAHGLDQIQCALGMDESGPIEVSSTDGPYRMPTYDKPVSHKAMDKLFKEKHLVSFRYATPNGDVTVKLT
ncbi:MAG: Gfo/Idh/MocA family oxidoreductase, partial [Pirellulales bacterium]|nr:Gfo/Idh/MocA family oxidoreductase [Pirellulales bacterium]